jgi:hypothetical protein
MQINTRSKRGGYPPNTSSGDENAIMLALPLDKLAFIVAKARQFDSLVPPVDEDSGSNPSDDLERDALEDTPENPAFQELIDAIDGLNDAQRIELLALTWLGRGDFAKGEWHAALLEARRAHDKHEADYLVGTPLLADYLEEGVSLLGYSLEEFEIGRL